jgi:pimeloyl-ACP methyl ester carboxylesterase
MAELASIRIAGFPALESKGRDDRPPLLFVHGAFVLHETWANWMGALARAGWRGVAPSRRGRHGVGPDRCGGLTTADYVEDTLRVVEALGERPIVIGHSLGGLIAQKVAELDRCRAAVLLASAPPAILPAQPIAIPALAPMLPRILLGQPLRPSCQTCETIVLNKIPVAERTRIHDALVHESGKVYREMIFGTFRIDAGKARCPLLIVGGREDRIVSPSVTRGIADRYHTPAKIYEGHGHWLIEEPGWERVAADVADWLAQTIEAADAPASSSARFRQEA